ncbi:hypothetical protein AB0F96_37000 [Streptomyces sp. NPDC023998]|uniref:hypothetical protein n=1 Tax=Streptomyces sp. NPDC023998 TaxID=3154597 RepID=UPI0033CDADC0
MRMSPMQGRAVTAPTVIELVLPAAGDLSWEQYSGRACVWCDRPITRGGRSVGIARGRMGAHVLDIEVYAGPCCPQKVEQFSASGARPDKFRHPQGDPACKPPR